MISLKAIVLVRKFTFRLLETCSLSCVVMCGAGRMVCFCVPSPACIEGIRVVGSRSWVLLFALMANEKGYTSCSAQFSVVWCCCACMCAHVFACSHASHWEWTSAQPCVQLWGGAQQHRYEPSELRCADAIRMVHFFVVGTHYRHYVNVRALCYR